MPAPSRAESFGRGVALNLVGQVGLAGASFLLLPTLIRGLGQDGYGLYGLIGLIAGHLCLLTLGAPTAAAHAVADEEGRGGGGLGALAGLSLTLHVVPVAVGTVVAVAFREPLIAWLGVAPAVAGDAGAVLAAAAAGAVFLSVNQFCGAVFQGLKRFDLSNVNGLAQGGGFLLVAVAVVASGGGVRGAAWAFPAYQAALAAVQLPVALRLLRRPTRRPSSRGAAELLSYGATSFLAQLTWSVTFQWDKLLVAYFCPLSLLGYYLVPSFLVQKLGLFPVAVGGVVFPFLAELNGRGESAAARRLFAAANRLVLTATLPAFVFLGVFAPQLLTMWLGADFSVHGVWPLRWLVAGWAFHMLTIIPSTAVYGLGAPRHSLYWGLSQAAVSALAWPLLIPRWGPSGAAMGFLLGQALTGLPFAVLVSRRWFDMAPAAYAREVLLPPFAAGLGLAAALWPLRHAAWGLVPLAALAAASGLLYYLAAWALLPEDDRRTARTVLARRFPGLEAQDPRQPPP